MKKKIKPGKYSLINKETIKVIDLIKQLQKESKFKAKIKWLSTKIIREKIFNYDSLPNWKSKNSDKDDLVKFILNDNKN